MVRHFSSRRLSVAAVAVAGVWLLVAGSQAAFGNVPVSQVSSDPYVNVTSFHKTQVEPDTYAFGQTIVGTFQSGRFRDGGSSNVGWATSTDSGGAWTHGFLPGTTVFATPPGPYDRDTDPSVAYDASHKTWLINTLAMKSTTGVAVIVNRSTDGGLTWSNPVVVAAVNPGGFFDKNWITCDNTPSSPFYGHCYVEYDETSAGNRLHMSTSKNGGLTWNEAVVPPATVIGGQPLVQPSGKVIMPIDDGFESQVESFVSSDGGATYTGPFPIASISSHNVAGGLRTPDLPSADVDINGRVYVVWSDCRFRTGCSSNDIVISSSADGITWTPVARVPTDPVNSGMDHFLPGVALDRGRTTSGRIGVTYFFYPVANCSSATCQLSVGYQFNPGTAWLPSVQVAGPMSLLGLPLTSQGYMVGDYTSTSFSPAGKAYPIFALTTGNVCQIGQNNCNLNMVAPTNGLRMAGGRVPSRIDRPVPHAHSDHPVGGLKTAN